MSNGSIRVQSKTIYTIEVNDNGEYIEFDLSDVGLEARFIECNDKIQKELADFTKKENDIIKKIQKEAEKEKEEGVLYTENEKALIDVQVNFYKTCRNTMDIFLGENACQKIFGDSNFPTMFIDLFEALSPEFKKMGLNYKEMQKNLYSKYAPKNKKVLK